MSATGRALVVGATSGFGHLTGDVCLLPSGTGSLALRVFVSALESLPFTLRSHTVALVRPQFSVVGHLFTTIRDPVPLIRDPVALSGNPLASEELSLPPREGFLVLIELSSPAIEFTRRVGTVLSDHNSR